MTFSIHMANIVFHDKPEESDGKAEEIRNDPTSSPHSRGTRPRNLKGYCSFRIIPAFAGDTPRTLSARQPCRDHPRIRGEHSFSAIARYTLQGSSPHSRGTPLLTGEAVSGARIIPAFAGNTEEQDRNRGRL